MELVLNTVETEPLPEPRVGFVKSGKSLLNSNFKAAAAENFTNPSDSVFGKRQHLKFRQFNRVNAIGVVLKLSIFVIALSMIV